MKKILSVLSIICKYFLKNVTQFVVWLFKKISYSLLYATFEVGRGCAFSTYSKGWRGSRILHFVTCIVIFSVTHAWGGQVRRGIAPQKFRCVIHRRGPFFIGWGPSKIIRYFDCSIVLSNYVTQIRASLKCILVKTY